MVFGGATKNASEADDSLWLFHTKSGHWSVKQQKSHAKLPAPRSFAAYTTDKHGILWMFGGHSEGIKKAVDLNDTWSLSEGVWTHHKIKDGPSPRRDATLTLAKNGHLYLIGGFISAKNHTVNLSEIWHLNPQAPQKGWKRMHAHAHSFEGRRHHVAVSLNNTSILVHGGADSSLKKSYADAAILDLSSDLPQWSPVDFHVSGKRSALSPGAIYGHTAVLARNTILLFGGKASGHHIDGPYALNVKDWSWLSTFGPETTTISSVLPSSTTSHIIYLTSATSTVKSSTTAKKKSSSSSKSLALSSHASSTKAIKTPTAIQGSGNDLSASTTDMETSSDYMTLDSSTAAATSTFADPTSASTAVADTGSTPKTPIVVGSIVGSIALALAAAAATLVLRRHSSLRSATFATQRLHSDNGSHSDHSSGRGSILGPFIANRISLAHKNNEKVDAGSPLSPQIWDNGASEQWQTLDLGPPPVSGSRCGSPERQRVSTPMIDYGDPQSRHRLRSASGPVGFVGIAVAAAGAVEVARRSGVRAARKIFGYTYEDNLIASNADRDASERTRSWRARFNRTSEMAQSAQAFPFPLSAPISPVKNQSASRQSSDVLKAMAEGQAHLTNVPWLEHEDDLGRYPKQVSPRLGSLDIRLPDKCLDHGPYDHLSRPSVIPSDLIRQLENVGEASEPSTPFSETLEEAFGTMDVQITTSRRTHRETSDGSQASSTSESTSRNITPNLVQGLQLVRRRSSARTISGRSVMSTTLDHNSNVDDPLRDPVASGADTAALGSRPSHTKSAASRSSMKSNATRRASSRYRAVTVKKSQIFVANPDMS